MLSYFFSIKIKNKKEKIISSNCGHLFCDICSHKLFEELMDDIECPCCRKRLNKNDFHEIFL
jgi:rubredoxin